MQLSAAWRPDLNERLSLWAQIRAEASEAAQFISRPVWIGVLAMLFACGVAVYGFVGVFGVSLFCSGTPPRGANIDRALWLGFLSGLAGPVAIGVVRLVSEAWEPRLWRPLLAAVLLLEAAILGLAIALVALDSATHVEKGDCFAEISRSDSGPAEPDKAGRSGSNVP
jgi:hypothetical protein